MSGPIERAALTARYGITPYARNPDEHYASRHIETHSEMLSDRCEPDARLRCRCSGAMRNGSTPGSPAAQCCARMTGEDLRCDECREWCYAVRADPYERVDFALVEA